MNIKAESKTWRNRICGQGEVDPHNLVVNPRNWRAHPKAQREALAGVLDEVGWVQDVIVSQGTGHIVDGHLRVALAVARKEPTIPVKYVDLDEAEEALVLLSLDPLAGMAEAAQDRLAELVKDVQPKSETLQAMLDELGRSAGISPPDFEPIGADEQSRLDQRSKVTCPECGHEFTP